MMNLDEIIKNLDHIGTVGNVDTEICGLCADSSKVSKGDLFICYKGGKHDSHDCAKEAVARGAAAVVCEHAIDLSVPQIIVRDGRACMARIARIFLIFRMKNLKFMRLREQTVRQLLPICLTQYLRQPVIKPGL